MCLHSGHFRWPHRLPWPYYATYYIHLLWQKFLTDAQAAFIWNPILKLTEREPEKVIEPSGQVYMFSYLGVLWNSYRDRFRIGYFDRFETQHLIWLVLHVFVKQTAHENIKIIMTHCNKFFSTTTCTEFSCRQSSWWRIMKIQIKYLLQKKHLGVSKIF